MRRHTKDSHLSKNIPLYLSHLLSDILQSIMPVGGTSGTREQPPRLRFCLNVAELEACKGAQPPICFRLSISGSWRTDGPNRQLALGSLWGATHLCRNHMQNVTGPQWATSCTFWGKHPDGPPQLTAAGGCGTSCGLTWYPGLRTAKTGVKFSVSFDLAKFLLH